MKFFILVYVLSLDLNNLKTQIALGDKIKAQKIIENAKIEKWEKFWYFGLIEFFIGDVNKAESLLIQSLSENPNSVESFNALLYLEIISELKNVEKIDVFREAERFIFLQNFEAFEFRLKQFEAWNKKDSIIKSLLYARAYEKNGDLLGALNHYELLSRLDDDFFGAYSLWKTYWILKALGLHGKANDVLKVFLEKYKNTAYIEAIRPWIE